MGTEPRVITLAGEYDIANAGELADLLNAAGDDASVIADLREVTFMDSAALSQLVRSHARQAAGGGSLVLVLPESGPVARVMTITGSTRHWPRPRRSSRPGRWPVRLPPRAVTGLPVLGAPVDARTACAGAASSTTVICNEEQRA